MGVNHVKNLEIFQNRGEATIGGIVDLNAKLFEGVSYPCFLDFFEAYEKVSPDIVVITANTQAHHGIIQNILTASKGKKAPALFIEKPLVETSAQATQWLEELQNYPAPLFCGYQFRYSPALDGAVKFINEHNLKIENIQAVWQKKRVPSRASAGVHIDEATHPIDLILNHLLPSVGMANDPVSVVCNSRKYDDSFIDKEQQALLYPGQPDKLIPLAEVAFVLQTPDMAISVFSSFIQGPQVREMTLQCSSDIIVTVSFDKNKGDHLTISRPPHTSRTLSIGTHNDVNKLYNEWDDFLKYYRTGTPSLLIPTLQELVQSIQITEMLNEMPLQQSMQVVSE
jgi:predicted dehydrogenase